MSFAPPVFIARCDPFVPFLDGSGGGRWNGEPVTRDEAISIAVVRMALGFRYVWDALARDGSRRWWGRRLWCDGFDGTTFSDAEAEGEDPAVIGGMAGLVFAVRERAHDVLIEVEAERRAQRVPWMSPEDLEREIRAIEGGST